MKIMNFSKEPKEPAYNVVNSGRGETHAGMAACEKRIRLLDFRISIVPRAEEDRIVVVGAISISDIRETVRKT